MRKVYNIIGLAQRAGQVSAGTMAARTSLIRKRACLLVMSGDISNSTRESLLSLCKRQKIPWVAIGNKYDLGTAVGKAYRVALTINDSGMAKALLDCLETAKNDTTSTGVVQWPK
ncbi:MAG TPA: ribosomal L7Ae/L30e/S12e/Gadd45 family protein [Syntrophomonadaceae bacterium]|nr:ribosomal L7Ae/L30e/S12e/Gadd45 family protein [Syntrophomonadaceae bacterium]HQA06903.1 ribosomal L7Ae/L30e/S12e/Gadd45 family protein [Syntrophomonadaceae bacterium]HQE22713.1 ribosomal L7Ae/L30e/S12e/Gadd45 family protein [Syntrophomonadaceae bacterium]